MKQRSRFYPRVHVDTSRSEAVGQAGRVLLTETIASDPTVSRTIDALAAEAPAALTAIDAARAAVRARVCQLAGKHAPDHDIDVRRPLIIDVDATLVTAHSEKEQAAPTFKRGFGFHPLWACVDHGPKGQWGAAGVAELADPSPALVSVGFPCLATSRASR